MWILFVEINIIQNISIEQACTTIKVQQKIGDDIAWSRCVFLEVGLTENMLWVRIFSLSQIFAQTFILNQRTLTKIVSYSYMTLYTVYTAHIQPIDYTPQQRPSLVLTLCLHLRYNCQPFPFAVEIGPWIRCPRVQQILIVLLRRKTQSTYFATQASKTVKINSKSADNDGFMKCNPK